MSHRSVRPVYHHPMPRRAPTPADNPAALRRPRQGSSHRANNHPPAPRPIPRLMTRILHLLEQTYGPRPLKRWGRAVPVLVETILSQNTSDANSRAGYRILRRTFKTWNGVADAPVEDVERAIRIAGLSNI